MHPRGLCVQQCYGDAVVWVLKVKMAVALSHGCWRLWPAYACSSAMFWTISLKLAKPSIKDNLHLPYSQLQASLILRILSCHLFDPLDGYINCSGGGGWGQAAAARLAQSEGTELFTVGLTRVRTVILSKVGNSQAHEPATQASPN